MPRPTINGNLPGILTYKDLFSGVETPFSVNSDSYFEAAGGTSRRKPSDLWIPPEPYTCQVDIRRAARGVVQVKWREPTYEYGYRYSGVVGPTNNQDGPVNIGLAFDQALTESEFSDTDALINQALIRARGNLKGSDVNLGIAFGERDRTARMLGDTASRLAKAARELRRGKVRDAMRTLGLDSRKGEPRGSNWTNLWLQLQYGWKPLLSDVYGACDALSKQPIETWRVSAKGSARKDLSGLVSFFPNGHDPTGYSCSATGWKGAFVRIDAIPSSGFISPLTSIGVTNPLEVFWELVPGSFVVDWALPIGSWLHSLDAALGYESCSTCTSAISNCTWQLNGISGKLVSGGLVTNDYNGSKRRVRLVRTVTGGIPLPSFPSFKDPRSFGHMANGLALLAQAFR